jgi:hypothetical protein
MRLPWFKNWSSNSKLRETYFQKRGENPDSAIWLMQKQKSEYALAEYPDATLIELCKLLLQRTGNWVSRTALCRYATKIRTQSKKKHGTVAKLEQKECKS